MVSLEERKKIVSDYIQLLVNSDHKFAFIKAVIHKDFLSMSFEI